MHTKYQKKHHQGQGNCAIWPINVVKWPYRKTVCNPSTQKWGFLPDPNGFYGLRHWVSDNRRVMRLCKWLWVLKWLCKYLCFLFTDVSVQQCGFWSLIFMHAWEASEIMLLLPADRNFPLVDHFNRKQFFFSTGSGSCRAFAPHWPVCSLGVGSQHIVPQEVVMAISWPLFISRLCVSLVWWTLAPEAVWANNETRGMSTCGKVYSKMSQESILVITVAWRPNNLDRLQFPANFVNLKSWKYSQAFKLYSNNVTWRDQIIFVCIRAIFELLHYFSYKHSVPFHSLKAICANARAAITVFFHSASSK